MNRKFGFRFGSKIQSQFLAAAFFKLCLSLVFNQQVFKFGFFVQQVFFLSAKFRVVFVGSLKLASRFLACVSVCGDFDWLCFTASALFVVGLVGSQNRLVFFCKSSDKLSL